MPQGQTLIVTKHGNSGRLTRRIATLGTPHYVSTGNYLHFHDTGTARGIIALASRAIPRGAVIAREFPLMVISTQTSTVQRASGPDDQVNVFRELEDFRTCAPFLQTLRTLSSQVSATQGQDNSIRDNSIWAINAFNARQYDDTDVLCTQISRINHACNPNAHTIIGDASELGRISVALVALTDIPMGSEVTISYIGQDNWQDATERINHLQTVYGFTCSCLLCSSAERAASDVRRALISRLRASLEDRLTIGGGGPRQVQGWSIDKQSLILCQLVEIETCVDEARYASLKQELTRSIAETNGWEPEGYPRLPTASKGVIDAYILAGKCDERSANPMARRRAPVRDMIVFELQDHYKGYRRYMGGSIPLRDMMMRQWWHRIEISRRMGPRFAVGEFSLDELVSICLTRAAESEERGVEAWV